VLKEMRSLQERGLVGTDLEQKDRALVRAVWRFYGRWKDALVAAGVVPVDEEYLRTRAWWRQHAIHLIRHRLLEGRSLREDSRDCRLLVEGALRYFDTWDEALRAAGVISQESSEGQTMHGTEGDDGDEEMG
jgi:hypothetical protein